MSLWTHIIASIEVDTYIYSDTIEDDVVKMLQDAPQITGNEGNANIFVNMQKGYNCFTSCDCLRCVYNHTRVLYNDGFECAAPDGYQCPHGQYQTCVIITIVGDLRDRSKHTTKREWEKFYKFIKKQINGDGFNVRQVACSISGTI